MNANPWIGKKQQENDESELKKAFAGELLRTPADPFRAALAVFGANTNKALRVANEWPSDGFVIDEVKRLKVEQGELAFLPSKADLARAVWERAHAKETEDDDFTKMARLYAEILDYIPKVSKVALTGQDGKGPGMVQVVATPLDEQL